MSQTIGSCLGLNWWFFLFYLFREWILMHLKKMKRMKLRMLMETRKRQSFCEEQIKEAFVKFDKMRELHLCWLLCCDHCPIATTTTAISTPPESWAIDLPVCHIHLVRESKTRNCAINILSNFSWCHWMHCKEQIMYGIKWSSDGSLVFNRKGTKLFLVFG